MVEVTDALVIGKYELLLTFADGVRKRVNLRPYLKGPVFKPVRNTKYFSRVFVDHEAGTIVWPNGADLDPEFLYEL